MASIAKEGARPSKRGRDATDSSDAGHDAKRSRLYGPVSQSEDDELMFASPEPYIKEELIGAEEASTIKIVESENDDAADSQRPIPLTLPAQISGSDYDSLLDEEESLNRLLADSQQFDADRAQQNENEHSGLRFPSGNAVPERSLSPDAFSDEDSISDIVLVDDNATESQDEAESLYGDENAAPVPATLINTRSGFYADRISSCRSSLPSMHSTFVSA
jgi:hypothetical protein